MDSHLQFSPELVNFSASEVSGFFFVASVIIARVMCAGGERAELRVKAKISNMSLVPKVISLTSYF